MSAVPQLRFFHRQACVQVVRVEIKIRSDYYNTLGKDILIRTLIYLFTSAWFSIMRWRKDKREKSFKGSHHHNKGRPSYGWHRRKGHQLQGVGKHVTYSGNLLMGNDAGSVSISIRQWPSQRGSSHLVGIAQVTHPASYWGTPVFLMYHIIHHFLPTLFLSSQ